MISTEQRHDIFEWIIESIEAEAPSLPLDAQFLSDLDWSLILESTPSRLRGDVWQFVTIGHRGAVLAEMRPDARKQILGGLTSAQLMSLAKNSSSDEIIDFIDFLPEKIVRGILKKLSPLKHDQVTTALEYNEDQLGRYITYDALVVLGSATVADIILDLKNLDDQFYTDRIYVVDDDDNLLGSVDMHLLALKPRRSKIEDIMQNDDISLLADMEPLEAVNLLKGSQENHLPVVDENGCMQGVFSYVTAMALVQQNFEGQLSHLGNVSDEDLFAPVIKSSSRRAVWLGINLVTAFIAAAVIGLFEATIAEVVALAVLMPIVASMGGIAGSQTLTLAIRGLATGQLSDVNTKDLGIKEISVSLMNGILWAVVVAGACFFWFESLKLAMIIAFAILANMLIAAISGVMIPVLLDRQGIDPALAGSVILTTVTDVAGFFIFLGLATIVLI